MEQPYPLHAKASERVRNHEWTSCHRTPGIPCRHEMSTVGGKTYLNTDAFAVCIGLQDSLLQQEHGSLVPCALPNLLLSNGVIKAGKGGGT